MAPARNWARKERAMLDYITRRSLESMTSSAISRLPLAKVAKNRDIPYPWGVATGFAFLRQGKSQAARGI